MRGRDRSGDASGGAGRWATRPGGGRPVPTRCWLPACSTSANWTIGQGQGGQRPRGDYGPMSAAKRTTQGRGQVMLDPNRQAAQAKCRRTVRRRRPGTRHRSGPDGGLDGRRGPPAPPGHPQGHLLSPRGRHWVRGRRPDTPARPLVRLDCDGDTVLWEVDPFQAGARHTGEHTCFDADVLLRGRTNCSAQLNVDVAPPPALPPGWIA